MRLARTPSLLGVLLLVVLWTVPTFGDDINWINPIGGNFADGGNWSGGLAPGSADNALFGLNSPSVYTITIPDGGQVSNNSLRVGTDQVSVFFANGSGDATTYALSANSGSLIVGENSGDIAQLTLLAQNSSTGQLGIYSNDAIIADQAGSMGTLIVGAMTSAQPEAGPLLTVNGPLIVGNAGAGSLYVADGVYFANGGFNSVPALNTGSVFVGNLSGSSGTVTMGAYGKGYAISGLWTANGNANIAAMPGSTGVVNLTLGQWNVNGDINVGGSDSSAGGTATLNVSSYPYLPAISIPNDNALRIYPGGAVNLDSGIVSVGYLDGHGGKINFNGGELVIAQSLDIGAPGDVLDGDLSLSGMNTSLSIGGNTNIDTHQLQLDGGTFATGTLSISHGGSVAFNSGSFQLTNSDLTIGPGGPLGSAVTLKLDDITAIEDQIVASGQTTITQGSSITLSGGLLATGTLAGTGSINFNSGYLLIKKDLDLAAGQPFGTNVNLASSRQSVSVMGQTTIEPGTSLSLSGAELDTGHLVNKGSFNFSSGILQLTNSDFSVGPAGLLGSNVSIVNNQSLSVSGQTTIEPGSSLAISGGSFETGNLINNGSFQFLTGGLTLDNDTLTIGAGGLLGANFEVGSDQLIDATTIVVNAGSTLAVSGGTLYAGTIFSQGNFSFSSGNIAVDNITVGPGEPLGSHLKLNANQSLYVGDQIVIEEGSTITISGGELTSNAISGTGKVCFQCGSWNAHGEFDIGPGELVGPSLVLGDNQNLEVLGKVTVETGGMLSIDNIFAFSSNAFNLDGELDIVMSGPVTEHGEVKGGSVLLNGPLYVSFANSFLTSTGESFDIVDGSISGSFTNAPNGAFLDVSGRTLEINYNRNDITLTDVTGLPEPSGAFAMVFAAAALLTRRRRGLRL